MPKTKSKSTKSKSSKRKGTRKVHYNVPNVTRPMLLNQASPMAIHISRRVLTPFPQMRPVPISCKTRMPLK